MTATAERLERKHGPVTSLFPDPKGDRSTWTLSREAIAFFHEHGYVMGGPVLNTVQIQALRRGLEAIRSGENTRTGDEPHQVLAAAEPSRHQYEG